MDGLSILSHTRQFSARQVRARRGPQIADTSDRMIDTTIKRIGGNREPR